MPDAWDEFQDQPADEWSEFTDDQPAPKDNRRSSMTLGILKGIAPASRKLAKYSPANIIPGFREANEASLNRLDRRIEERGQTARPNLFGEIAGNVATTAWIPGGPVKSLAPAISGGAQGALLAQGDDPGSMAEGAVGGAVLGHLGGKAVNLFSDAIQPYIAPAVRRLSDAGVKLTPGMVKGGKAMVREDKMMSRPVVGDVIAAGRQATQSTFNTAAVNEALKPLGKSLPSPIRPGNEAIDYAKGEIGRAYDLVIPNLSVKLNGQQFAQTVMPVARNLKPAQQKQLQQIVSNELGAGQLQGEALKRAQGNLRRLAGKFRRSQDANDQLLGEALGAVDDELTGAMIAQNPKWAPQLQKVNEAYRGYRIVADAAGRADDGLFTTGQLKQSVRRGDFTKSKDATARGQAFMQEFSGDARAVIPARTPDSGTAGRQQAGNMFAQLGGARDAFAYRMDDAYQQFRLAPRPAFAAPLAQRVQRLAPAVGSGLVIAAQPRK